MEDGKEVQKGVEKLCFVVNKSNYAVCKGGSWDGDKEIAASRERRRKKRSFVKWALCYF